MGPIWCCFVLRVPSLGAIVLQGAYLHGLDRQSQAHAVYTFCAFPCFARPFRDACAEYHTVQLECVFHLQFPLPWDVRRFGLDLSQATDR